MCMCEREDCVACKQKAQRSTLRSKQNRWEKAQGREEGVCVPRSIRNTLNTLVSWHLDLWSNWQCLILTTPKQKQKNWHRGSLQSADEMRWDGAVRHGQRSAFRPGAFRRCGASIPGYGTGSLSLSPTNSLTTTAIFCHSVVIGSVSHEREPEHIPHVEMLSFACWTDAFCSLNAMLLFSLSGSSSFCLGEIRPTEQTAPWGALAPAKPRSAEN